MNAQDFGTKAQQQRSLDEFGAKYGSTDYAVVGQQILDEQRKVEYARREAEQERDAYQAKFYLDREVQDRIDANDRRNAEREAAPQRRYDAARSTQRVVGDASPAAVQYLVDLSASRTPHVTEQQVRDWAASVPRRQVSDKIDELKKLPKVTAAKTTDTFTGTMVPAGRYAVTGEDGQSVFVHVDRPTDGKWKGYIFVKMQFGDQLQRTSRATRDALLAKIEAAGVQDAMLRYGREIGSCGHCGRTLTNEESRAAGIGPICRGKMGW